MSYSTGVHTWFGTPKLQVRKITVVSEAINVIQSFADSSSLHGVRYTAKRKTYFHEKITWFIIFLSCMVVSIWMGQRLITRFRLIPTVIAVKDTNQPLHTFPFPSITVCPGTKVKKTVGAELLAKYVDSSANETAETGLWHVMSALSLLQYPSYVRMNRHLREGRQWLYKFNDLNVTHFMELVLPKCYEVFRNCFWHGKPVNCCEIFMLQRTEEGYCYSFNSLTAEATKNCPLSEILENEGVAEDDNVDSQGCKLRRNTGMGTGSGLELFLAPSDPDEDLGPMGQRTLNGVTIQVHTSYEFPEAGTGIFVPNTPGAKLSLAISLQITVSSPSIRALDTETRGCMFPDEQRLNIHHIYTESSCLIECRNNYIALMCKCNLYFFASRRDRVITCGIRHLSCIVQHSAKFKFYRPPVGTPGITEREVIESLNCQCKPTCFDTVYDTTTHRSLDKNQEVDMIDAYVDIYYGKTSFVRYQRYVVFGSTDLLVSIGGIANLFLGFSFISLIELGYWMYKLVHTIIITKNFKHNLIKVHPIHRNYTH